MAARWMQQKIAKLKVQNVAFVQAEGTKAYNFNSKPDVPAYDAAMVKRVQPATKARKTIYRPSPAKVLVRTGSMVGSWDKVGTLTIVRRG